MPNWRPAKSILALQREIDDEYPSRPRQSDGLIGDAAHAARVSDHNPNSAGVVTAWDITAAPFCDYVASRLTKDPRTKYVIWSRRIWSRANASAGWRPYDGDDPHTSHIHLSVSAVANLYDDGTPWHIFDEPKVSMAKLDDEDRKFIDDTVKKYIKQVFGESPDLDKFHTSLNDLNGKLDQLLAKP